MKGLIPKVGDRVLVEASYNANMPFKWNASRVITLVRTLWREWFEWLAFAILYIKYGHQLLKGNAVAQSVERGTPGEKLPGSIPAVAANSLLVV